MRTEASYTDSVACSIYIYIYMCKHVCICVCVRGACMPKPIYPGHDVLGGSYQGPEGGSVFHHWSLQYSLLRSYGPILVSLTGCFSGPYQLYWSRTYYVLYQSTTGINLDHESQHIHIHTLQTSYKTIVHYICTCIYIFIKRATIYI